MSSLEPPLSPTLGSVPLGTARGQAQGGVLWETQSSRARMVLSRVAQWEGEGQAVLEAGWNGTILSKDCKNP